MGGNLGWTLRCEDGTEYRMHRWTHEMPELIIVPAFLDGEQAAIDTALADWLEMKADWEENSTTGIFRNNMTPFDAPFPYGLKPSEYGLVVTDFLSKTILSLQAYTNLGRLNAVRQRYGPRSVASYPVRVDQVETWSRMGRIHSFVFLLKREESARAFEILGATIEIYPFRDAWRATVPGDVDLVTLDAICDRLRDEASSHPQSDEIAALRRQIEAGTLSEADTKKAKMVIAGLENHHWKLADPFIFGTAELDLAPFTFEEFNESPEGFDALRARVLELGFTLSAEEEAGWAERRTWCLEEG